MIWSDWSTFFAMGGYGLYVWGSLGMCALVPLAEIVQLALRNRALQALSATDHAGVDA